MAEEKSRLIRGLTLTSITAKLLRLVIVSLLMVVPVLAQAGKEQKSDEVIRLKTELVTLDVQIVNKKTQQLVSDLTQNDFEVYEDGVKQELTHFSQDKLPLSVVLLLDTSGSMWPVLEKLRSSAYQALQSLKPEDEVAIMATAAETKLVQGFTREKFSVSEKLREMDLKAYGDDGIFMSDSLARAAILLRKAANPVNRRVIIVITDNVVIPNNSSGAFRKDEAVSMLLEYGVVVCGVTINLNPYARINNKLLRFPERHADGDVNKYAEITGGEVLSAGKDDVGQRLAELINHLRTRYSLAFTSTNPAKDGKFRGLKVRLSSAAEVRIRNSRSGDYSVKNRSGYYAGRQ
jgi:VWFA-related protein